MTNTQYVWMVEAKTNSTWVPVGSAFTRDESRALQKYMKMSGQLGVRSRIRRYEANNDTRG